LALIVSGADVCTGASVSIPLQQGPLLQELIDGVAGIGGDGTIVNGSQVFSDFGYSAVGDMPEANLIRVNPIIDGNGNAGIQFQGPFQDRPAGGASDALITYRVRSDVGLISAHLIANVTASDSGFFGITETFAPPFDPGTVQAVVGSDYGTGIGFAAFDSPVTFMDVQKNILFEAEPDGARVIASFIDQSFAEVPEPTSVALAVVGLLSLMTLRRKR
jgi:hypothetical protein